MSPKMLRPVDLEDGPLVLKGAEETSEECVQALGQLGSSSWTGTRYDLCPKDTGDWWLDSNPPREGRLVVLTPLSQDGTGLRRPRENEGRFSVLRPQGQSAFKPRLRFKAQGLLVRPRLNTSMKAEEAAAGTAFKELTRQRHKTQEMEEAWKKRRLKKVPKNSARRASEEASSNGLERTISREPRLKRGDEDSLEGTLRRHLGGWPQRGSGKTALQEDVGTP